MALKILVFQHEAVEPPGTFEDFWAKDGHGWTCVHLYDGEPIPPLDLLLRLIDPLDAQDASYFAASARIFSFWSRSSLAMAFALCSKAPRLSRKPNVEGQNISYRSG